MYLCIYVHARTHTHTPIPMVMMDTVGRPDARVLGRKGRRI